MANQPLTFKSAEDMLQLTLLAFPKIEDRKYLEKAMRCYAALFFNEKIETMHIAA